MSCGSIKINYTKKIKTVYLSFADSSSCSAALSRACSLAWFTRTMFHPMFTGEHGHQSTEVALNIWFYASEYLGKAKTSCILQCVNNIETKHPIIRLKEIP